MEQRNEAGKKALLDSGIPGQDSESAAPSETELRKAMLLAERQRLTGVSGWLAAFFVLYVLGWFWGTGLLIGLASSYISFGGKIFILVDWIGRLAVLAALFTAKNSGSVAWRKALAVQALCAFLQLMLPLVEPTLHSIDSRLYFLLFIALVYHLGWLVYFTRSWRVLYTYDRKMPLFDDLKLAQAETDPVAANCPGLTHPPSEAENRGKELELPANSGKMAGSDSDRKSVYGNRHAPCRIKPAVEAAKVAAPESRVGERCVYPASEESAQGQRLVYAPGHDELVERIAREIERRRLTGLGGWLALFMLFNALSLAIIIFAALMFNDSDYLLARMYSEAGPVFIRHGFTWAFLYLFRAALICCCLYQLLRLQARAVPFCRTLVVFEAFALSGYVLMDPGGLLRSLCGGTLGALQAVFCVAAAAYAIAWWLYFGKSRRVRLTLMK